MGKVRIAWRNRIKFIHMLFISSRAQRLVSVCPIPKIQVTAKRCRITVPSLYAAHSSFFFFLIRATNRNTSTPLPRLRLGSG